MDIATDALETWIDDAEQAARMLVDAPSIVPESAVSYAQETLRHLAAVRKLVRDQKRRSKAQSQNASTKKGFTLATDLTMLAEYEKKLRNRDRYSGGRSNTAIATDVGRSHGLKKSGALKALERARAFLRENPAQVVSYTVVRKVN